MLKAEQADSGAVALIQRFGSAANLDIHQHGLVPDGDCRTRSAAVPELVEVPAPTDEAQRSVLHKIITRSVAFGPRAGQKVLPLQGAMLREADFKQTPCADINGSSLHTARAPAASRGHTASRWRGALRARPPGAAEPGQAAQARVRDRHGALRARSAGEQMLDISSADAVMPIMADEQGSGGIPVSIGKYTSGTRIQIAASHAART